MLSDIFIILFVIAFLLQIISVYEKSIVFSMLSIMFWLVLMVNANFIEVPYVTSYVNATGAQNITTGAHTYTEVGLGVLLLGFIFFDIIWAIVIYMDFEHSNRLP